MTVHELREENQQRALKGIKAIEPAIRPREKMLSGGAGVLSDAVLALLIGSGSADQSAVGLGARIMALAGDDARKLAGLDFAGLCMIIANTLNHMIDQPAKGGSKKSMMARQVNLKMKNNIQVAEDDDPEIFFKDFAAQLPGQKSRDATYQI